jgi:hypothetical protein
VIPEPISAGHQVLGLARSEDFRREPGHLDRQTAKQDEGSTPRAGLTATLNRPIHHQGK